MNNIDLLSRKKCTGCGMCSDICPKAAIRMIVNTEGFYEPFVQGELCVDCGICAQTCPQMNPVSYDRAEEAYAVICRDDIREQCSSGGVFGAVAQWAISMKGTVFGAAFTDDFKKVRHIKAANADELKKLYKSKYFQSETSDIFSDVKETLKETDKPVVFCGCPCQIAALRNYLGKDYDNLITIDLLCHGVVSPKVYEQFLNEITNDIDEPITNVDFRSKKKGWSCNLVVDTADSTQRIDPYDGTYFRSFLWGYSQRNVCFECKYARPERVGDITLGDFWGIDNILPEMNDKKGTSLVLCNTQKGRTVLEKISKYISKQKSCDMQDMLNAVSDVNWALIKPGIRPQNRDVFFYRLSKGDTVQNAFNYASTAHFDVGIFGWWFEDQWTNYGSTLTYYALMEYVSSLGLSVCMLTSPYHKAENASDFIKGHGYRISPTYSFADFRKHNANIDTYLLGSDQLWFYDCYKRWGHSLFLDFADDDKKKVAYATSFGHKDPHIPDSEINELKRLLHRFDAVSSRETDGVDILKNKFGLGSAVQNLDPVFLCDIKNWQDIADEAERKANGDFIFTYMLDPTEEKIAALKHLSLTLGHKIVAVTDKQYNKDAKEDMLKECGILKNATISELIYHLMNAKYVLTDSYHGTCFCLIFRKSFASVINAKRGTSRFDTIAELFGVGDRFVTDPMKIINNQKLLLRPDYSHIDIKIKKEANRSRAWLNDKLLSPCVEKKADIDPLHQRIIKDFNILNQLGYNVGRYLMDMGINTISVYCDLKYLDIFEPFLVSLNIDSSVNVTGYYSDKDFMYRYEQSINFGCAYFQKGMPQKGVVVYVSDSPKVVNIGDCKVLSLVSLMWEAMAYASIFRPLVQFKKEYPEVNMLVVNYPRFPASGYRDSREEDMINHKSDFFYENLEKNIPESFSVFKNKGYSNEDWLELFRAADSELNYEGKRRYTEYKSKLKNIIDGHRITPNRPNECSRSIYMIGGCTTFGYGCADTETTSYYIQELINNDNEAISVENYGAFLNYRRKDMYQILFDLPVKSGDIVVVEVWRSIPSICSDFFDFLDLQNIFYRPHNYGNVFIDYSHLSSVGQEVVAKKIYQHLKEVDYYKENTQKADYNRCVINPISIYGIPNDHLDNSAKCLPELQKYVDSIRSYMPKIGAIVMNCNPFTLGHRYLIETASKHCLKLYIFVVEEDKSVFKFNDRIELVRKGTADLENVMVLPSGKFMISSVTFKDYFNKSEIQDKQINPSMDIEIFAKYIAPALGITVRFAGEEPLDMVTKQYNDTMRRILPQHNIEFFEIPRKESGDNVISASRVRRLLDDKNFEAISKLVPETTLNFLKSKYGGDN